MVQHKREEPVIDIAAPRHKTMRLTLRSFVLTGSHTTQLLKYNRNLSTYGQTPDTHSKLSQASHRLASPSAPSCTSFPSRSPSHGLLACWAVSVVLFQAAESKSGQDWKGQRRLNKPGAVLVAIKAASIRKVPEPHIGSASTCPT